MFPKSRAAAKAAPIKIISPTAHGVIDYAHAAFFCTMGLLYLRSNKQAAAAAFTTSGFVLVQSLLTDYSLGAKPVLSFETHGKLDAAFAAGSWLMSALFDFAGTSAAKVFAVNSIVEASVVAMTDWDSQKARGAAARP